MDTAFIKDNTT